MSSEVLTDLTLRIRANTAELSQGLDKAGTQVNKFAKKGKETGKQVSNSFGQIKSSVSGMAGTLTSSLTGALGPLGSFAGMFPAITAGFAGATGAANIFKVALAATGIGLVVVALGALVTYLTKTQSGMDIVAKVTNVLGAVMDAVIERVGFLGEAIFKLMSGDAKGAVESVKKAYIGLGDQIEKNYNDAKGRSDDEVALREEKIAWITKEAELEAQKAQLMLKSREEEKYSAAERVKFIQEAAKLQKQVTAQNIAFKERELAIQQRIVAQGITTAEDRTKLANLQKEAIKLKEDEANKLRSLVRIEKTSLAQAQAELKEQNEINASLERRKQTLTAITAIKPESSGEAKIIPLKIDVQPVDLAPTIGEFDRALMVIQDKAGNIGEVVQNAVGAITTSFGAVTDAFAAGIDQKSAALENMYSKERSAIESSRMSEEQKAAAIMALDQKIGKEKEKLARKQAKMAKAAALVGAIVNTAMGVTQALAQGGPLGLITGAIVAAAGAVQIGMIASTPIPAMANGGISKGGTTLVGERGPELVNLPQGARVNSYEQSKKMTMGAQTVHVHITGRISGQDIVLAVEEAERRNAVNF